MPEFVNALVRGWKVGGIVGLGAVVFFTWKLWPRCETDFERAVRFEPATVCHYWFLTAPPPSDLQLVQLLTVVVAGLFGAGVGSLVATVWGLLFETRPDWLGPGED